jgi:ferric-dicitrate binding protein FerR (iron transport regulator)
MTCQMTMWRAGAAVCAAAAAGVAGGWWLTVATADKTLVTLTGRRPQLFLADFGKTFLAKSQMHRT